MEHHARRQDFDELTDHKAIYHQLIETAEESGNNQKLVKHAQPNEEHP
uniref:Uncharacterized protein n=1 Tax=Anguilla anguilla TaxID=7936 RepID=A0A0E9UDR2_ANGAN